MQFHYCASRLFFITSLLLAKLTSAFSALFKEWELTNKCTARVIAECQHFADSLGVSLLDQQLNDGLAIGLNQVFTLCRESIGQVCAHLLHSLNHLLLRQRNRSVWYQSLTALKYVGSIANISRRHPTSVAWSSSLASNSFITNSQTAQNGDSRTRTKG